MIGTAFDRFRSAQENNGSRIEPRGDRNFMAQCPSHDDRTPSLHVTSIETQALVHCFAGCDVANGLAALNLTAADLFDTWRNAVYRYPGGRAQTRWPDKGFSQSGNKSDKSLFHADKLQQPRQSAGRR